MTIFRQSKTTSRGGFTLVEVLVAMTIVGVLALAGMSAMYFNRIQNYKDKERGLILDFAMHYLETIKGLPFVDLKAGSPINALYTGSGGSPNISIPSNTNWVSLLGANFTSFHPELAWLTPRNPEMSVKLTTTQVNAEDHTKLVQVEFRWDAPLGQGIKQTARMDMARFKDL